ncbi:MAG: hypothetical protein M0R33_15690 [Methylomonas sp.]|jgi:hypothetical protein|uniref:hypothetical protein n=1 Tax=Methylomonas sp. TaxID=418 RepID=UPI0025E49682|nr:hypothetical protein [Methylomonas sp.]MCK9607885.1 hypothetical protein [Methylomonas sp.]
MNLAPIVLFVYNRPEHTRKTVESLKSNELAEYSDLIIYSDGPIDEHVFLSVNAVRDYLKTVVGFNSVVIIEREFNIGLAANIIDGVTTVVNKYGKVIVLEDDIITSPVFLTFMNRALAFYENESRVWHISGWNYPINPDGLGDTFLLRIMNCWGWASWADRWVKYEKSPQKLIIEFSSQQRSQFDLDDSGVFWSQIVDNAKGKIDTWAIFWYATIFRHNGLCLNPAHTFIRNIGHDGSGIHCTDSKSSQCMNLSELGQASFPTDIIENETAVLRIKNLIKKKSYLAKLKIWIRNICI